VFSGKDVEEISEFKREGRSSRLQQSKDAPYRCESASSRGYQCVVLSPRNGLQLLADIVLRQGSLKRIDPFRIVPALNRERDPLK
jgi:hypothetical protein